MNKTQVLQWDRVLISEINQSCYLLTLLPCHITDVYSFEVTANSKC